MTQKATVIGIKDSEHVLIKTVRKSACEACHKGEGGSCKACDLVFAPDTVEAVAVNKIGAKEGDKVIIESRSSDVIGLSALVFLLPIVFAAAGYLLSTLWIENSDISVLFAFLGLLLGGVTVFAVGRYGLKSDRIYVKEIIIGDTIDES